MEQQSVTDPYNATNQLIVLDEHGNEVILSNIHHSQPIQNVQSINDIQN